MMWLSAINHGVRACANTPEFGICSSRYSQCIVFRDSILASRCSIRFSVKQPILWVFVSSSPPTSRYEASSLHTFLTITIGSQSVCLSWLGTTHICSIQPLWASWGDRKQKPAPVVSLFICASIVSHLLRTDGTTNASLHVRVLCMAILLGISQEVLLLYQVSAGDPTQKKVFSIQAQVCFENDLNWLHKR